MNEAEEGKPLEAQKRAKSISRLRSAALPVGSRVQVSVSLQTLVLYAMIDRIKSTPPSVVFGVDVAHWEEER